VLPVLLAALLTPLDAAHAVDRDRPFETVEHLAGERPINGAPLRSRHIEHPDHAVAGAWVVEQFEAVDGLDVQTEGFSALGQDDLFNVIADLRSPLDAPEGRLVLGAHWDSTASFEDDWDPLTTEAPGADDDASGVAVLLEVARVLATHEGGFAWDVRFIAFDAEEEGLIGSYHHVEQLDVPVTTAVILDPVGYNPGDSGLLWFAFHASWPEAGDAFTSTAADLGTWLDVSGVDQDLIGGDARSDHYPFWLEDIPAIHVGTFPQPPAYHTSDDRPDVVDPQFLAEVTALVAAHAVSLAGPLEPEEPDGGACDGCSASLAGGAPGATFLLLLAARARRQRT